MNRSPYQMLLNCFEELCKIHDIDFTLVANEVPKKWKLFGDLALIPKYSFRNNLWNKIGKNLFLIINFNHFYD